MSEIIDRFEDQYRFLSNFEGPSVRFDLIWYPTVEHAYQAAKCASKLDRLKFANSSITASQAKRMGREITLRSDWEYVKVKIMEDLLGQKFAHPDYSNLLSATKDVVLREGNFWHDNFWGDCMCKKCDIIIGQNNLGKLLMKIRANLKGEQNG